MLISIGFGNYVSSEKVVSVLSPDSAPIKRLISESRESGFLVDASFGRSTRSVILMNSRHVILSSVMPDEFAQRMRQEALKEGSAQS